MRLEFTNPVYLWFLLSIPFLIFMHFFTLKHSKGAALKFANFEAIAKVSKEYRLARPFRGFVMNKNIFMLIIRGLTLLFVILSLAGTVFWYTGRSSEFDFVLAIDASSSMLASDLLPNRLEAAKSAASLFVDNVPEKVGVGVVSFSGTAFVEQKITEELEVVKGKIDKLGVKKIGGTDLGGAVVSASNILITSDKSKVIVLLTDGRSNVGITTNEAIDYANSENIVVHTIGVGTEEGGSFSSEELVSTLDETTLNRIASQTKGRFYRAKDEEELNNAYKEIADIKEVELSVELSFAFMMVALLLLFSEWILINTRYKVIG